MTNVEDQQRELKKAFEKVDDMRVSVATIEERTKNTDEAVKGQSGDLRKITDHFLDESRSFARRIIQDDQRLRNGGGGRA